MKEIIKLLRPHQYVKNLFVFAPLIFTFHFIVTDIINTVIVFVLFSLLASSIYVLNDYMDIEEDKQHPKKKFRPLASGEVNKNIARVLIVLLSGISLFSAYLVNTKLFIVLLIYFILNIAYSLKLKHITIVDIFIIATGFVLRLFAGASVIETPLSMWIIIMTFLLALFLALAKRRDDVLLASEGKETRKNIDGYNLEFVNATMVFMSGVIVVSYILYTVSGEVLTRLHTQHLYLTAFFVILGIMRYMQITFVEENSGSPTKIVLKDRFLQITILFWLLSFYVVVSI
ncbi:decaprenyl-phosphate phosphoribosyltransferase [Aliarcobacter butzleri]|uniref:decaprenyl-phosphate phosphoribosyltransferase n=1 Tax=Aliarcobacter butzleri TaxID=28197 RepID=UPI0021B35CFA|nr:decaprenyl-phosphate phosphoribosyltransferase [Aliarcobacter butzleri]MCT7566397.1 decaprenyl-phosphate phosphoribosyltransferase [Aliarcobacter butzleri]MCT7575334.1 decaprenyl-phosphate phosphoribosyltransferase [Aliarcobacter butzleri]MCT7630663.1 decaprenyl-phosphate phosphoribosyltransferase [Aliarcobacter butzleri]